MNSRPLVLALFAATPLAAQSGRTLAMTTPPRLGTTMRLTATHPVAAQGNYYEALFSLPTARVLNLGIPTIIGALRIDLATYQTFLTGFLGAGGSTTIDVPVPNLINLVGGGFDLQLVDVDIATLRLFLSDNDVEIRPYVGICKVHLSQATSRSTVTGNNDLITVDDASVGMPVSKGVPAFACQSVQPRGQGGFVEGYGGPFTGISHNSDIEAFTATRVAKYTANAAHQVVSLPNGRDVALVRLASNQRHFRVLSIHRSTGAAAYVPNLLVIDSGPLNSPVSNWQPHAAFSSDGQWGVVIARDTNPAVADRVYAFRTDASASAIELTATVSPSSTYFDGATMFAAGFILVAGTGGWYWTPANAPARLTPLSLPNTTANNAANRWVYPMSWRVAADGSSAWFPIGSDATDTRGVMDIVRVTNQGGVPLVTNVTRFAAATAIAEFGYSAVTPSPRLDSSFGMKAALSPDGSRLAFLGMNANTGVYLTDAAGNPARITVPNASFYSELTYLNASTVLFCAGPDPASQNMYQLDVATGVPTALTTTSDLRTRGQFWSSNRRYWYFVRSNGLGTVNNFVTVDAQAPTVALRDITGGEFSNGTAPALRTGGMNATTDPWPGLEFQLRRVPQSDLAVFTARRTVAAPNTFEDANIFRFDIEHGGPAKMLTANVGTGTALTVRNIESLAVTSDPLFVAWAERAGIAPTSSEDVYAVSLLDDQVVRLLSVPDPTGQSVVDGSIRFTCLPSSGVVWAVGKGRVDVPEDNVRVEWSPLGTRVGTPVLLTPAPVPGRVYQVVGTSQ